MRKCVDEGRDCILPPSDSQTVLSAFDSSDETLRNRERYITELHDKIAYLEKRLVEERRMSEEERQKLEEELAAAKMELEMKLREEGKFSEEDKHFYGIYEAEATKQQDCCKLCNVKEEHCDTSCIVCGHRRSHHQERLKCSVCSCDSFEKGKDGKCSQRQCSHPKEKHLMIIICEQCKKCNGYKKHMICSSHAYPKAVLIKKCKSGNIHSIFNGRRCKTTSATSCWWYFLCSKCEMIFSAKETKFAEILAHQSYGDYHDKEGMIRQVDADVLLINTFRALPQSVRFGQFEHCCQEGHKCREVYPKFQSWVIHAKKKLLTMTKCTQEFVTPAEAGIQLFHFNASFPEAHLVEFPIICDVEVRGQSHLLIYAQIPPFYWAFLLDKDCATIIGLDDFPRVIDIINTKLAKKRNEFFSVEGSDAHTWDVHSRGWQKKIDDKHKEWVQANKKLTTMQEESIDDPNLRKPVECKDAEVKSMYSDLLKMKDEHVAQDKLVLVFAYLSDHCLSVPVDVPIFST